MDYRDEEEANCVLGRGTSLLHFWDTKLCWDGATWRKKEIYYILNGYVLLSLKKIKHVYFWSFLQQVILSIDTEYYEYLMRTCFFKKDT